MTKVSQKHYFLIVVAVCFLFSSVANAFVMYSHSMADNMSEHTSSEHTSSVVNEPHSSEKLHHHSSHRDSSHSHHHDPIVAEDAQQTVNVSTHDCCDDDDSHCAPSGAACSFHCSASVIEANQQICPLIVTSKSISDPPLANPVPWSPDAPFKPPRK